MRRRAPAPDASSERFDAPVPPRAGLRRGEVRAFRAQLFATDPGARRPGAAARGHVFHAPTDGSRRHREADGVAAIARMHDDPDRRLRRGVRRFLARYRRTGRVHVG